MEQETARIDWWRLPALCLWAPLFAAGLFPEWCHGTLRELGRVAVLRAITNSPWAITFLLSAYIGWFVVLRCREAGQNEATSAGKGLQIAILSLMAFTPLHLENLPHYMTIPVPEYRWLMLSTVGAKGVAWLYLVLVMLRYYLLSGHRVFAAMPSLFPSTHKPSPANGLDKEDGEA